MQEQKRIDWLYNIDNDPSKQHELSRSHSNEMGKLRKTLYGADSELVEQLWSLLTEVPIVVDYNIDKVPNVV